jgi:NADH dehydrogenase
VADSFGVRFTGRTAYLMWGFIHVLYVIGWGNRLGTWLRSLMRFSANRGYRVITQQGVRPSGDRQRHHSE